MQSRPKWRQIYEASERDGHIWALLLCRVLFWTNASHFSHFSHFSTLTVGWTWTWRKWAVNVVSSLEDTAVPSSSLCSRPLFLWPRLLERMYHPLFHWVCGKGIRRALCEKAQDSKNGLVNREYVSQSVGILISKLKSSLEGTTS